MKIWIWGAGNRGKELKEICDRYGTIEGFVDNDKLKSGTYLGLPVLTPESVRERGIGGKACVWIATEAKEVSVQAKELFRDILEWNSVRKIIQTHRRPSYPEIQLDDRNIQNCKLVRDRSAFLKRFADMSGSWKMIELGVAFGEFSEQILRMCTPKKLYLVDCWDDERYVKGKQCVFKKFEQEINTGIVEVLQGFSTQKLEEFKDNELDWAYIDTLHDYKTTKKELELCHKKVKDEGYICGHDYTKFNVYSRIDYGVYDAVNEFAVVYDYEFIYLSLEKNGLQSFCLRKLL